ncbi:MAG: hypothetical protein AAFY03_06845, partial [Pseudomonadota bacterium]
EAEEQLDQITQTRADLRKSSGIFAADTQRGQIVTMLETQRRDTAALRNDLALAESRLAAVRSATSGGVVLANLPSHPLLTALDEKSVALLADAKGARAGPERNEILDRVDAVRQATEQALADHAQSLASLVEAADLRIAEMQTRLAEIATFESEWATTERSLSIAEDRHRFFADRVNELQSLADLRQQRIGNIVVLQQPSEPRVAARVRNKSLLIAIAVFGFITALAWVALREFLDDRVRTSDDVETLTGRTPLATVPRRASRKQSQSALSLAAAELAADLRSLRAANGTVALHMCAAANDPRNIAAQALDFASVLEQNGFGHIRIVNLAAWTKPAALPSDGLGTEILNLFNEDEARDFLNRVEEDHAELFEERKTFALLVTPPLDTSPVANRAAQISDVQLLTVVADKDSLRQVDRAMQRQTASGVNVGGILFMAGRAVLPRFLMSEPI